MDERPYNQVIREQIRAGTPAEHGISKSPGRTWEEWYPTLLGLFAGFVVSYAVDPDAETADRIATSLGSEVLGVASILAGFQGTTLGVVMSLRDSPTLDRLKRLRIRNGVSLYGQLMRYIWESLLSMLGLCACLIVLLAFAFWSNAWTNYCEFVFPGLSTLGVHAGASTYRVTKLMYQLLDQDGEEHKTEAQRQ